MSADNGSIHPHQELRLQQGVVEVWLIDIGKFSDTQMSRLTGYLSSTELEQNARFHADSPRRRDVICRGVLRRLLCSYLDTSNSNLEFSRNDNGKPRLLSPKSDLRFNYSHSGDWIAYAIVQGVEVGIDIEHSNRRGNLANISENYFSTEEVCSLAGLPDALHREQFFALWTLKEAYIKARGEGVFLGLDNFSFKLDPRLPETASVSFSSKDFDTPEGWQFLRSGHLQGYPVAVALCKSHLQYQLNIRLTEKILPLLD